jgi:two-component system, LytTR family, sensor kinase
MNRKAIIKLLLIIVFLMFLGNLMAFILEPSFIHSAQAWLFNSLFSAAIGLGMMKSSEFIMSKLNSKFSWETNPGKKIAVTLGIIIFLSTIVTFALGYFFNFKLQKIDFAESMKVTRNLLLLEIVVIIYVFSVSSGIEFFRKWKDALVRQESLQRNAVELQLEILKNQVNPHFLFNCLNTLTALIYKDADKAVEFTVKLADIYRYALENRNHPTVPWPVERKFVENYVLLQQIRFGGKIILEIAPAEGSEKKEVVPLSVQTLVENAIKHNQATGEESLHIFIYPEEEFLVVKNNLKPVDASAYSKHVGLENIRHQYEILANRNVEVVKTEDFFTVKLPLITVKPRK